jgi:hypothetical protein
LYPEVEIRATREIPGIELLDFLPGALSSAFAKISPVVRLSAILFKCPQKLLFPFAIGNVHLPNMEVAAHLRLFSDRKCSTLMATIDHARYVEFALSDFARRAKTLMSYISILKKMEGATEAFSTHHNVPQGERLQKEAMDTLVSMLPKHLLL